MLALSLASQLPQVLQWIVDFVGVIEPCGSWLASDGGVSGATNVMGKLICNLI
jgi:hypothetical protein